LFVLILPGGILGGRGDTETLKIDPDLTLLLNLAGFVETFLNNFQADRFCALTLEAYKVSQS
jgi:hypothetical protein